MELKYIYPKISCHKCQNSSKIYKKNGRIDYRKVTCNKFRLDVPSYYARYCDYFEPKPSYKKRLEQIKRHNELVKRLRKLSLISMTYQTLKTESKSKPKPTPISKPKRGRPRKHVPIGLVIELRKKGYTMKEIVEKLRKKGYDVTRQTIYNRFKELGINIKKIV